MVKIVSDGTPSGTKVFLDNGADITKEMKIARIQFNIEVGRGIPEVVIGILRPMVELSAEIQKAFVREGG